MHKYVARWSNGESSRWREDVFYIVAALFAYHPIHWSKDKEARSNLGDSFARLGHAEGVSEEGVERRFTGLLSVQMEDLHVHLRHAVSLLKSKAIPIELGPSPRRPQILGARRSIDPTQLGQGVLECGIAGRRRPRQHIGRGGIMFVEIHILQNFAPSNLNRDDTGMPKDCEFGGYRRARISSQCFQARNEERVRCGGPDREGFACQAHQTTGGRTC